MAKGGPGHYGPDVALDVEFSEIAQVAASSIAYLTGLGCGAHLIEADGTLRQVTPDQLRLRGPDLVKSKGDLHNLDNVVVRPRL